MTGSKDEIALDVLPYLAMGFAVVNVDYRLARVAPAPAAVQDSRCALRWVVRHAPQYGFDPARAGAGGQLGRRAPGADGGAGAGVGRVRRAVPRQRAADASRR